MNNQLLKNPSRYLYTEYGQPYYPAVPARPGYWWVASAPQWAWVPVKTVYGRPLMGHWSITMYWFDPYQRKNMEWYGQASEGQEIRAPYITRGAGSREEIQIRAPDQKTQIWEPPTPAIPEQPFIPDRHVYEDNSGWDAGGRECVASVDLGTKDFGSSDMTSLSAAYAGIASAAQAVLTVQTRQGAFQYRQRACHPRLQQQRFDVGRGMRDTHYELTIQAPAHGLELADLTFDINNSSRKI